MAFDVQQPLLHQHKFGLDGRPLTKILKRNSKLIPLL